MQLALLAFRLGRRRWEARRERDAGRVRGAAGRGVTMGWRIALETRRGGGSETRRRSRGDGLADCVARGRGLTAGRGAGPWCGGEGFGDAAEVCGDGLAASVARGRDPWRGGELSHLAFVKFTWSLPLLIIKQLTHEKGAGEHNLVPPGTAMCLGVA